MHSQVNAYLTKNEKHPLLFSKENRVIYKITRFSFG